MGLFTHSSLWKPLTDLMMAYQLFSMGVFSGAGPLAPDTTIVLSHLLTSQTCYKDQWEITQRALYKCEF